MALQKVNYKGNTIDERYVSDSPVIFYDGKIVGDVLLDKPRTLKTKKTLAKVNIMIGSAILACKNKAILDDIEVIFENVADPTLENNTWEKISETAKKGEAQNYWQVGDTKETVYTYGITTRTYTARIVDFDHYDAYSPDSYGRTKAGITFELAEVSYDNPTYSSAVSRANSDISSFDFGDYAIKFKYPMNKNTLAIPGTSAVTGTSTKNAKGILPSEMELFGKKTNSYVEEGTQFAFYAAGNSKVKKKVGTTTKVEYWMRSIGIGSDWTTYPTVVNTSGASAFPSGTSTGHNSRFTIIFCI